MSSSAIAQRSPYTWKDYRSWGEDERWEIIDGEAHAMSPAPSVRHQCVQTELTRQVANRLLKAPCRAMAAPIDVKLSETTIVHPDLVVVCRREQIRSTHIEGAPALVIEILSPSTAHRDRGIKTDAYARAGVAEVWLVTPWPPCVEVFVLDGASYRRYGAFVQTQPLTSPTLPDLTVDLAPVFNFPVDPGEEFPPLREPPARYGA
jgi:Uma2 family endonuclease